MKNLSQSNNSMLNKDETTDKLGLLVSVLCCVHCMAIPVLILVAPTMAQAFAHEVVHIVTFTFVLPIGLYAFISKLKVHQDKRPLYIGIFGMLVLAFGLMSHELFAHETFHEIEIISSIVGGLSLIAAHALNIKLCRCKTCTH